MLKINFSRNVRKISFKISFKINFKLNFKVNRILTLF